MLTATEPAAKAAGSVAAGSVPSVTPMMAGGVTTGATWLSTPTAPASLRSLIRAEAGIRPPVEAAATAGGTEAASAATAQIRPAMETMETAAARRRPRWGAAVVRSRGGSSAAHKRREGCNLGKSMADLRAW